MRNAIFAILAVAIVLVSGCCGSTPQAPLPSNTQGQNATNTLNVGVQQNNTGPAEQPQNADGGATAPTGEGTIVDVGGSTGGSSDTPTGSVATSQQDCATLTPTCDACVAKSGCGWCKTSSTCFYGDANGPRGDPTCQPADWSVTVQGCQAPVGGCASKTNCADCLSGSGCKWCQAGTKCADSSSAESCGSGGWRTTSYQCYAGQ